MIDKRISYRFGGGYQGSSRSSGPAGGASSGGNYGGNTGGGGGHRGGGADRDPPPAPKPAPKPAPAPQPTRAPDFITGADLHKDPVAIDQGFVDTKPEPEKTYKKPTHSPHTDIGPVEEPYEMAMGVKVPVSMIGVKGVDPREDPERYFEDPTKKSIDDVMAKDESDYTIEDKEIIEDFERSIDWDKVKKLSDQGYNFEEIQDAMNKGLLTKVDPRSMKTNLLDRGIRSIRNIIPETGLQRSLLNSLTKNVFAPTEGGMFDVKKMGFNLAKNYAMKKLGLGALNPILGIASLFGFDPFKSLTNKFAKKPVDMSAFNKLGLYADRYPTATDTLTAKVPRTTAEKIATGDVDLNKLITGDKQDTSSIEGQTAKLVGPALTQMRILQKKQEMEQRNKDLGIEGPKFTPKDQRMLDKLREMDKEDKVYKMPILTAAHGGRIDKPLTGRRRDI